MIWGFECRFYGNAMNGLASNHIPRIVSICYGEYSVGHPCVGSHGKHISLNNAKSSRTVFFNCFASFCVDWAAFVGLWKCSVDAKMFEWIAFPCAILPLSSKDAHYHKCSFYIVLVCVSVHWHYRCGSITSIDWARGVYEKNPIGVRSISTHCIKD